MSYLKALSALLARDIPQDTILLCHSRAVGRRMITQAAKACILVGVRAESPASLAAQLCSRTLSRSGAPRLMAENEAVGLMLECIVKSNGYFTKSCAASLLMAQEIYRSYTQLEQACIPPDGSSEKLTELKKLFEAYQAAKTAQNVWDRIDLLKEAVSLATECAEKVRMVALPGMVFTRLERTLIQAVAGDRLELLPMAAPDGIPLPVGTLSDTARETLAPFAALRGRARFCACRGTATEVQFVFRDILARGEPLERCAIVYPSSDYAQRIYETAQRYYLPVQLVSGISITCSSLFMVLQTVAALPEKGFDAEEIRQLLLAGCLNEGHPLRLARALREQRVGWGERDRYRRLIARLREDGSTDNETLDRWEGWLDALFDVAAPEPCHDEAKGLDVQRRNLQLLLDACDHTSQRERAACHTAAELLGRIHWLQSGETLLTRLLQELRSCTILAGNVQPGKLLCVHITQALCTGAEHLYVVGLSRDCFSSGQESSVLLDAEAEQLMEAFPGHVLNTRETQEQERVYQFCEAIAHHGGDFTFTYSCFDTTKLMKLRPCALFETMRTAAAGTTVTVPLLPEQTLTAGDERVKAATAQIHPPRVVEAQAPPLPLADEQTWEQVITEYVFSASSMESALKCPFFFYLRHILHLSPPDLPRVSLSFWLPKNEIGTFCHAVLELYYRDLNEQMDAATKKEYLDSFFDAEYENLKQRNPAACQRLEAQDREKMRTMIQRAIDWTEEQQRTVVQTEQKFGMQKDETPFQTIKAGKSAFRLKGSIDRVDRMPDGSRSIVDYKTGDPKKLDRERNYHLQHYLYREAERMIQNNDSVAKEAGYLLLDETTVFLNSTSEDDRNAADAIESLLTALRTEENALAAAPWEPIDGKLKKPDLTNAEDRKNWLKTIRTNCYRYCNYKALCPLLQEGADET